MLRRFDLVLFTACAIVGLDSVAAASQAGAQAVTWLAVSLVLFLIPYGMLVAELGSAFPVEGGPYEWARMSFGRAAGAVTAVLYWLSNPIWVGGTLTATTIAALDSFILHRPLGTGWEIAVGLVFTWVTVGVAIVAFRIGKWGPSIGTFVKIGVVVLFTVLFIVFLVQHGRPAGASTAADLKPSVTGFLTAIGILVFLWVGFEVSSGGSEEMRNPRRDVPVMIAGSGVIGAVLYGLVILGIVLVIPRSGLSAVAGFTDAYTAVAGVLHSRALDVFFAVLVILTLVGSGSVWLEGADRTQAVAALDGAAPAWMGRFASFGTPIAVNLSSGAGLGRPGRPHGHDAARVGGACDRLQVSQHGLATRAQLEIRARHRAEHDLRRRDRDGFSVGKLAGGRLPCFSPIVPMRGGSWPQG